MEIEIVRKYFKSAYTIGTMLINGSYFCDTLELPDRGLFQGMPKEIGETVKITGNTAIPVGRYPLGLRTSKFSKEYDGKKLPQLFSVDFFTNIRIHHGNSPADTEGCIIIGTNSSKGKLSGTRKMVDKFIDLTCEAIDRGEKVFVTITRQTS
ncbi:MAG: DUF5675 family protein [Bacteroidales bacterium]|nr:DUF5675 family protein [Bacteroidales bacterium]